MFHWLPTMRAPTEKRRHTFIAKEPRKDPVLFPLDFKNTPGAISFPWQYSFYELSKDDTGPLPHEGRQAWLCCGMAGSAPAHGGVFGRTFNEFSVLGWWVLP